MDDAKRPEDLIYRTCYVPEELGEMLASADTRSRIRKLPAPQLYFGLQHLSDEEVKALLPHITEEQWTTVLDLDLWSRDRVRVDAFAGWHRHLLDAADPVARKLLRGTDPELWQLLIRRRLKVHRAVEEEFEGEPGEEEEWFLTPDRHYLIVLPSRPELARLLRPLILRLYQLDPEGMPLQLESALGRTSIELEEEAYQQRRRRVEDLGFQDYFDALSIYAYLDADEELPEKEQAPLREVGRLPVPAVSAEGGGWLLLEALARLEDPRDSERLLEEIAFASNKVLSADRVTPSSPERIRRGVRKTLATINLGLDCWSEGNLERAVEGVRRHYLQSFFQYGYSRLMDLQQGARQAEADAGSFAEAVLDGIRRRFPLRTVRTPRGPRRRFFRTREELEKTRSKLDRMAGRD